MTPEPLSRNDFKQWEEAARVMQRIVQLLDAARPELEALVPDRRQTGPMSVTGERIYRTFSSDRLTLGVGFNPGSIWGHEAIIDTYVTNKTLDPAKRRAVAARLRANHPDEVSHVEWATHPSDPATPLRSSPETPSTTRSSKSFSSRRSRSRSSSG